MHQPAMYLREETAEEEIVVEETRGIMKFRGRNTHLSGPEDGLRLTASRLRPSTRALLTCRTRLLYSDSR
jgi:hypothetical protein